MSGFLVRAAIATWVLLPLSVWAAPSPSPSLNRILVAPPAGYTAFANGPYHGRFTAREFAATWGTNSATAESQLNADGFVDGYGLMWKEQATGRYLAEFVIAFQGGNGAENWLGSEKVENEADSHFQRADTMDGIGPYYFGVHGAAPGQVLDGFEFVKGNDVLGVAFWSPKDDVLELARSQSKRQYDAAPAWTIPSWQWPENARDLGQASISSSGLDQWVVVGLIFIVALFAGGGYMYMRRAEHPAKAVPAQEMSADVNYWWNGSGWIANSETPPPWAQRSPDGAFWWDGRSWQPVPQHVAAPPGVR